MKLDSLQFESLSEQIWASNIRREDLVLRVTNALREQVLSGKMAPGTKFLPEADFARNLGISRPSLREAIRVLAREGLITVKHGVGTFVTVERKPMLNSLELMRSITEMIRASGGEPACRDLKIDPIEASDQVAKALDVEPGAKVGRISRVRLINDRPFVVAKEYLALDGRQRSFENLTRFAGGSLYEFLREHFNLTMSHSKLRITAVAAETSMAQVLNLRRGAPLLQMHEIHYGFDGKPALLAINYHNTEVVEFSSMRSGTLV